MQLHRNVWPAIQGTSIGLLFLAACAGFGYLIAPDPSLAQICARTTEQGSSAWVACVDRKVQERAQ
ncbi:hypothetical protein GIV71_15600 [Pseudomonas syringae]|uniref:hypothetical protein n=1 Tax=Pseudomonas syringae TaxID=317 RepID=UPI001F1FA701|nr:hypothetical protein [Pseudomonas syringae]MCF5551907.1 hypothetical protein [Pseudomonas syringae]